MRLILLIALIFNNFCQTLCAQEVEIPKAQNGVINLKEWNLEKNGIIKLAGEWEFYHLKFLNSSDFLKDSSKIKTLKDFLIVPADWNSQKYQGVPIPASSYGTYRLIIHTDTLYPELNLKLYTLRTAGKLFIDGKLMAEVGKISSAEGETISDYVPQTIRFNPSKKEIEIIIQVSSYDFGVGGLLTDLELGTIKEINRKDIYTMISTFFIAGALFLIGFYHLGLFLIRRTDYSLLFFGLFCITVLLRLLNINEYLIRLVFPDIPWHWLIRLEFIGFYPSIVFFSLYVNQLFPKGNQTIFLYLVWISLILFLVLDLFFSIFIISQTVLTLEILSFIIIIQLFYLIFYAIARREKGIWIFLGGFFVLLFVFIHDVLEVAGNNHIAGFGVFIFVFSQAYLLSIRIEDIYRSNQALSKELTDINQNLEGLVLDRTKELQESQDEITVQNEELRQIQEEIQSQRDFLDKQNLKLNDQNKKIESSIRSAKTIQQAIFNYQERLDKLKQDYFIIYKPRDVVSGDFYWFNGVENKTILVVADCTGHGVEGAFMTLIGKNILDKIVLVLKITDPAEILAKLHEEIRTSLKQKYTQNNSGMDAIVVCLEQKEDDILMTFSGAKNDLLYKLPVDTEISELKGARRSIGGHQNEEIRFESHTLLLPKNSIIYMGSDGLQDQNDKRRKRLGKDRIKSILLKSVDQPMQEQKEILEKTLADHMKGTEQRDDILMIGFRL